MRHKKLINGKHIRSWLLSYFLILALPIALSFVPYFMADFTLKNLVLDINRTTIQNSQKSMDGAMKSIGLISMELTQNRALEALSNEPISLTPQVILDNYDNDYINPYYSAFEAYISSAYVYFPRSEMVYCNKRFWPLRDFYEIQYSEKMPYDEWYESVIQHHSNINAGTSVHSGSVFFIAPRKEYASNVMKFNVIVEYDVSALSQAYVQGSYENFFMCTNNGELVHSSPSAHLTEYLNKLDDTEENTIVVDDKNEKCYISQIDSDFGGWKYGYIFYAKNLLTSSMPLRLAMCIAVIFSIVLGLLFIVISMRKNSRPLRQLVQKFSDPNMISSTQIDEYEYLNNYIVSKISEKEAIHNEVEKKNLLLKNHIILNLLHGNVSEKVPVVEQLQRVGIDLTNKNWLLIFFGLKNTDNIFFAPSENKDEANLLAATIVTNIAEEMLNAYYHVEITVDNQIIIALLSFYEEQSTFVKDNLKMIVDEINAVLSSEFNLSVSVALSSIHTSIYNLHEAYTEAMLGLEYNQMYDGQFVQYSAIQTVKPKLYPLSTDTEQQICNCISTRSFVQCRQIVKQLLSQYSNTSAHLLQYLSYDLVCTFLRIAINENCSEAAEILLSKEPIAVLSASYPQGSRLSALEAVLDSCIDAFEKHIPANSRDSIYEKIQQYVNGHFNNPNLNVNFIADTFDINASQLSYQFKKSTGLSLLQYITNMRIKEAKQLLEATSLSVNEIAQTVGYTNSRTFSRVFRAQVSMSPGEYRQLYKT